MKRSPTAPSYTAAVTARFSLTQTTAKDIGHNLNGASVAIREATSKAGKLARRADFAALTGDLERLAKDLADIQATVEWLRQGSRAE